ncbi:MAG: type II secretion system protein [Leptothrix sp. (in: b-proteobacteria)]
MTLRQRGFTYLGVMFLVALLSLTAAMAGSAWSFIAQRDRERELMYVGREYRRAIERYRADHAQQPQPYPTQLSQLLGNREQLVIKRYLRRLYPDPISGSMEWGLLRNPQGGIVGLYSLSMRKPVRRSGAYIDESIDFKSARSHRDWVFVARIDPPGAARAGTATPADAPADAPVRQAAPPPANWDYEAHGAPPARWVTP